ncbi:MAG: ATP-binding protein [Oscillospiraceae bacterium]|nr:ATP-binding protein [Oscillospiraceae bacterium]
MVKLIVGVKGTGKTKTLINMANEALNISKGCVVCIEKGQKLKYDINYKARLINTIEYDICGADALYGLVCGLYAANYDITHIFIDSALKICKENLEDFDRFLNLADNISNKNNFQCIITASVAPENLPEEILNYTK